MTMNHSDVPFQFESHAVRTINHDGEIWFVASDVCAALEITNVTMALRRLDDDEQALSSIEGISKGNDAANIINADGKQYTMLCLPVVSPGGWQHDRT